MFLIASFLNLKICAPLLSLTEFVKSNPHIGDEPIDIEDLVKIGESCGP